MHLFVAMDCKCAGEQPLDPNEHLHALKVELQEAVAMVMDGRIKANRAAQLLLKAERLWRCQSSS